MTKENKLIGLAAFVAGILLTATVLIVVASFVMPGGIDNGPSPQPAPPNFPPVGKVVWVHNQQDRTPKDAATLDCPLARALIRDGRLVTVDIDEDLTPDGKNFVEAKGYAEMVKGASLPRLLFVSDDGQRMTSYFVDDEAKFVSLCRKNLTACPDPLPTPKAKAVVSKGGDMQFDGETVIVNGQRMPLTFKPQPVRFGAVPAYSEKNVLFPPASWRVVDRSNQFDYRHVKNQLQIGSCVAQSAVGALEEKRYLTGMTPEALSAIFNYAWFNDDRDQGGAIVDGPEQLKLHGTCRKSTLPEVFTLKRNLTDAMKKEAENFKLLSYSRLNSYQEAVSAIQAGDPITFAVMVGPKFNHFDHEGFVGNDVGPGNHAVHACEVVKTSRGWAIKARNSWGGGDPTKGIKGWGPFGDGTFLVDANIMYSGGRMQECIALRLASRTNLDLNEPPAYKPTKPAGPIADPPLALAF